MSAARKKLLVLCPYPQGVAAGQRLKYEQYFDDWRASGFDITVSSFMDMKMWDKLYVPGHLPRKAVGTLQGYARRLRDLPRIADFDLVYVFMWVTPFGGPALEKIVRSRAKALVFDLEDNLLVDHPDVKNPNPILRYLKGKEKVEYLIRCADHVISSSPYLEDLCREMNHRRASTYVSSSVDTDRFVPANPYSNDKPVVVGWTGTFSSRLALDIVAPALQKLAKRTPFKLKIIGNFDYGLDGVDLEVVQWRRETEVEDLQTFDIGIYPLPMIESVLGKSGLKAIQYMAFGLPTVATDVGTTPMIVRHGENGLLVRTEEEWIEALDTLIRDPDLRRRLGTAARTDAVEKHSLHAIAGRYRNVLESTLEATAERRGGGGERAATARVGAAAR
jgi:glycosyltransferase involved in cell wall biosynthesis